MIRWTMVGSCKRLDEVPPGARVTEVNAQEVDDYCFVCGKYLLENQPRWQWEEGVTCMKCGAPDPPEEVTRAV